jgi:hypothetical protein
VPRIIRALSFAVFEMVAKRSVLAKELQDDMTGE